MSFCHSVSLSLSLFLCLCHSVSVSVSVAVSIPSSISTSMHVCVAHVFFLRSRGRPFPSLRSTYSSTLPLSRIQHFTLVLCSRILDLRTGAMAPVPVPAQGQALVLPLPRVRQPPSDPASACQRPPRQKYVRCASQIHRRHSHVALCCRGTALTAPERPARTSQKTPLPLSARG